MCYQYEPETAAASAAHAPTRRWAFTPAEDIQLRNLVKQYGSNDWQRISSFMENRTARQCRERWINYLTPSAPPWTPEEDHQLKTLVDTFGAKWTLLEKFFSRRSDTALKNRYAVISGRKPPRTTPLSPIVPTPLTAPAPEKLEHTTTLQHTNCAVSIPDFGDFMFSSGRGYHAEEKGSLFFPEVAKLNLGLLPYKCNLFFFPSKSPCSSSGDVPTRTDNLPGCAQRITALNGSTCGSTTFACAVGATKLYQPRIPNGKAASSDAYKKLGVPTFSVIR